MKLKNKNTAVLGFGIEGKDLVNFLLERDAKVTIHDIKKQEELDFSDIDKSKVNIVCGKHYLDNLGSYDVIFRSPGIYRYIPKLLDAEKKGVEISSATKLFFELCPAKIIGVTGTKGKGTTSSLIYNILKKAKKDIYLAGNIGQPMLSILSKLSKKSWVVLELSSFQLIDIEKSPHIAVVLNITTDHLDWHSSRSEYIAAKKNIVKYQTDEGHDVSVVNYDYKDSKGFEKVSNAFITYYFSSRFEVPGCYVSKGEIVINWGDSKKVVGTVDKLKLRGKHNWENITAAVCAAAVADADIDSIRKAVFSFKGLEHRLELVRIFKRVSFYNDSFATGPQPTIAAIRSFDEPITIILGGYDKGHKFDQLAKEIVKKGNVKCILLIGDTAGKIDKELIRNSFKGNKISLGKPKMEKLVNTAFSNTQKGGVVLLSTATASFDMFDNYKQRGELFKKAVKQL